MQSLHEVFTWNMIFNNTVWRTNDVEFEDCWLPVREHTLQDYPLIPYTE